METILNKHYAKKLKLLRTKSSKPKLIQKDIAIRFGMKQQNYSKLENGEINFSDKILNKISEVFNITILEFISFENEVPTAKPIVMPNINNIDDYTTRILFASLRKQIAQQKVRIADLEIEARRQKIDTVISDNFAPLYVLI